MPKPPPTGEPMDAHEKEGRRALKRLADLASARWETRTASQRIELGGDRTAFVDLFVKAVEQKAIWLGVSAKIPREQRTLRERRRRLRDNPIEGELDGKKGVVRALPHLEDDEVKEDKKDKKDEENGSAAEREKAAASGPTTSYFFIRPLDDRETALDGFDERDLPKLAKKIRTLREALSRLGATPLMRRGFVMESPEAAAVHANVVAGLLSYEREILPLLLKLVAKTGERQMPDTRREVIAILTRVKSATGGPHFELVADILNWRGPRSVNEPWNGQLLKHWMAEQRRSLNSSNKRT